MRSNPGGEIAPHDVVGRDRFIEQFWRALETQSALLVSERRSGKTTVIKQMSRFPRPGWLVVWRDVEGINTAMEFAERVFRDVEEHLSKMTKVASHTRAFLSNFGGTELGGIIKVPPGKSVPWKTLLEKTFEDLMTDRDTKVVLLWDEMPFMLQKIQQNVGPQAAMEVLDVLRSIRQTHSGVRMVFSGSIGLHHVTRELKEEGHKNAPLNDLQVIPLPPLDPGDAFDLCSRLFAGESLTCKDHEACFKTLAESVDNSPFYIHAVVRALSLLDSKTVTEPVIHETIDRALVAEHDYWHLRHFEDRLASYYGEEWEPIAAAILDTLAVAKEPVSIHQLQQAVASNHLVANLPSALEIRKGDLKPLRELMTELMQDHYCRQVPGTGCYVFRFHLIRRWWAVHRGLL